MPTQLTQPSFAAGELSPALYSRTDLAKYHIGLRTMLNWYTHAQGGASNRPGTAWVGEVLDSTKLGRLIPFQFSTVQTYVLEFGDLKMRVIMNGGYVLETAKNITAITKANPGKVTAVAHGFSTGDRIYLSNTIGGMVELRGRYVDITKVDADNFTVGINTTGYTTYTSGGTAARLYTVTSPYAYGDLPTLKYEQSADTMTLTHKSYAPRKLTRTAHTAWTFTTITFAPQTAVVTGLACGSPGVAVDIVVTAINDATGEEGLQCPGIASTSATDTWTWNAVPGCSNYSVYILKGSILGYAATVSGTSFTDSNIAPDISTTPPQQRNPFGTSTATGVTISAPGSGYTAPTGTLYDGGRAVSAVTIGLTAGAITSASLATPNQTVGANPYITISDGAGTGANLQPQWTDDGTGSGQVYLSGVTVVAGGSSYHAGVVIKGMYFGSQITTITLTPTVAAGAITAVAVGGTTLTLGGDYIAFTLTATDAAGSGGVLTPTVTANASSNPGVNTYHDGRQWFMGTTAQPQTLWGSVAGAFNNMSASVPTRDSDAITRTLASRQVNAIKHAISLANGMIILTGGAEWKVSAGQADVITPAQFVARPQSYNGSSDIRPLVVNDVVLYVPESKMKVRSLEYQWARDSWSGSDMSLLAAHLFESTTLVDWTYARDPESICWGVRSDGVLLGFTFMTEQQVFAWHRHTTTGGTFESVCSVQEGTETAVYFIVNRTINGATKRYVERLHTRVFATIADAWFLDCGLQYSGAAVTSITGLWHLANESVYALADGIVRGPYTVSTSTGGITLPVAASTVTVGKIIPDADLELLDIDGQDQSGTWTGRKKKLNHLTVALKNSANQGLTATPTGAQATPTAYALKVKDLVNPLATPASANPALITDFVHQVMAPSWNWHGRALVRVSASPLPYTITGLTPDVSVGS